MPVPFHFGGRHAINFDGQPIMSTVFALCRMSIETGAAERIRTSDPRITNALLYRLSYRGADKLTQAHTKRGGELSIGTSLNLQARRLQPIFQESR